MAIQILSPQLANQIAAGEVVERPASVVKELIENSLDAGANKIQIDIEQGGANLIRIRDNGCGISKSDLSLALARHATSKIVTLEDLETILSLGFRGEALASISSVSRLTLTSRPAEQTQAWQVFAQGREMETIINPASHPIGTTVEVANLFFNTPARRRFLRTDKTEFAHIDEVVRRIALAKPQTQFILTHNAKQVRNYKIATTKDQQLKRLAAICGQEFVDNVLQLDWQYGDLHLYGWIATEKFYRLQNDFNYSYVNGRSMKDKTINHAVRQAFADRLSLDRYPAFVLFIDINPTEVDVNVHPAKQEVRFHQSRLVHDFIYQGVLNVLQTATHLSLQPEEKMDFSQAAPVNTKKIVVQYDQNNSESNLAQVAEQPNTYFNPVKNRQAAGNNVFAMQKNVSFKQAEQTSLGVKQQISPEKISSQYLKGYDQLLTTGIPTTQAVSSEINQTKSLLTSHLRLLSLVQPNGILLQQDEHCYLMKVKALQHLKVYLTLTTEKIEQQRLLIPLNLNLTEQQWQNYHQQQQHFSRVGFDLEQINQRLRINIVPLLLRQQNLQHLISQILFNTFATFEAFVDRLSQLTEFEAPLVYTDALRLLTETEQLLPTTDRQALNALLIPLDFTPYLNDEN
ncbi:DNA mismatch repair protein MutL [Mergibacter septicus]|uniref:DNA mismatch repair protein MutL n=1 Tax=Mergibacter septicus TaxID=221402 RepID=A0A8D4IY03_9PAST|nr:DNA mismatch repair endonuclease MutL [Mergibacter septicus]AWX15431.1 DNA mismatch repair protein MutL [Mergibacter septicus]QDJ14684.1 DNA mismatch repair protein MutL [Mergibacter septicus]UTU47886.1 DNA mismatch repair endonuclease MutL [Mergibacter septicus]WMR96508.1 DNA mismatch repair endonuclease MutL [Mergibacter septicus]